MVNKLDNFRQQDEGGVRVLPFFAGGEERLLGIEQQLHDGEVVELQRCAGGREVFVLRQAEVWVNRWRMVI